jgi:shikimate kinase
MAPDNRRLMLERGLVFCLSARPETLRRRVGGGPERTGERGTFAESRPLLAGPAEEGLARIQALLEQRAEAYAQAHHTIETDNLTPEQVCQRILKLCGIGKSPHPPFAKGG